MNKKDLDLLVSELDIDDGIKSEMLDSIRKGQLGTAMQALRKYRSTVLAGLHSDQDRLYQIDFVLQKAEEELQ